MADTIKYLYFIEAVGLHNITPKQALKQYIEALQPKQALVEVVPLNLYDALIVKYESSQEERHSLDIKFYTTRA